MIGRYRYHMVDKTTDNKLHILSLYRSNYLNRYHTRQIATLLKKSHVTLLPHLKDLVKDKILTSTTIGKNRTYALNLDTILTHTYILLSELYHSILLQEEIFLIKKITSEIFKLHLSGTILLFGSYAKRTPKEDSDIDLFYLGTLNETDALKIKAIGTLYGKTLNLKTATLKNFDRALREKDALLIEILKYHITLQNPDVFVNELWRYYYEIRQ